MASVAQKQLYFDEDPRHISLTSIRPVRCSVSPLRGEIRRYMLAAAVNAADHSIDPRVFRIGCE
jgi:hypothetical protein